MATWAERLSKVAEDPQPAAPSTPDKLIGGPKQAKLPSATPLSDPLGRRKLVLDTSAFIRLQDLDGDLFVTPGVAREIRDAQARKHISMMRETPQIRPYTRDDMTYASQFAALTGDLKALSSTDMEVIAASVSLFREFEGVEKLNKSPFEQSTAVGGVAFEWAPAHLPAAEMSTTAEPLPEASSPIADSTFAPSIEGEEESSESFVEEADVEGSFDDCDMDAVMSPLTVQPGNKSRVLNGRKDEVLTGYYSDTDSDGEWVTQKNISNFGVVTSDEKSDAVGCVTGDFSVQNVLMQMGIPIVTPDGRRIRTVKLWGYKCTACCTFTRDMNRHFCPGCGNHTLDKVPITVEGGKVTVHMRKKRRTQLRGTIYNIPMHKGGRHDPPPILCEDQLFMNGRDKALKYVSTAIRSPTILSSNKIGGPLTAS